MNNYAISWKNTGEINTVKAEYYEITDGFLRFFRDDLEGRIEEFASYSADLINFCVLQTEFTEDEILSQIKGSSP